MNKKSRVTAAVLAFLLGAIGVHRFYLGQTGKGLLYLLFCWTGIPSIVAFVDFIVWIIGNDADFDVKYNKETVNGVAY